MPDWAVAGVFVAVALLAICMLWTSSLLLRVVKAMHELGISVRRNSATSDRIEAGAIVVAKNLDDAQLRADAVEGEPGEASDAAAQSGRVT